MPIQEIALHEGQYEVATDPHRFKVICAGRRWGKSVLSRLIMLKWATETPGDYWIVGPTYDIVKKVHWDQGFKRELNTKAVKKWYESSPLTIELNNGSTIQLKSAENPDNLIGVHLSGLIIDEIAKLRNWHWLWSEALRPTLTDHRAPAIFISSPRGFNHFYDLYQMGKDGGNKNYKSWHFTSYDNPFVPKGEIDDVKEEIPLEKFTQEYLAEFTRYTGIIYKEFDEEKHVGWVDHEKGQRGIYLLGLDFATRGWVAAVLIYQDQDGYKVLDNYKEENLTAKEHAANIKEMVEKYQKPNLVKGYADPSGWADNQQLLGKNQKPMRWSLAEEYQQEGINIVRANNKVLGGINYVRQLFKSDKITIHPRCQDLIDELHDYQWKEQPEKLMMEKNLPEEPRKFNDHLVDSLRYALYSKSVPLKDLVPKPKWGEEQVIVFKPWNVREPEEKDTYNDKFTRKG